MTGTSLLIAIAAVWILGMLGIWAWAIWSGRAEPKTNGEALFLAIALGAGAAWPLIVVGGLVALPVYWVLSRPRRPAGI